MKLFKLSIMVCVFSLLGLSHYAYACDGARAMSMGGAFVGVADDAEATYWNPAGLTQLEGAEIAYTNTLDNRDQVNYDDFVSWAFPMYVKERDLDLGSLGVSFINSGFKTVAYTSIERWYWLSYGKKLPWGLSLGFNLRRQYYKDTVKEGWMVLYGNNWAVGPAKDTDENYAVDLSLLWKYEKFSFGLLLQDVNEPEYTLFGAKAKYIRNLRPGFAFRPDDKTILSLELYDVTGESKTADHNLRLGMERWFALPVEGTSLALRCGGYDINADDKSGRAVTAGLGYKWKSEGLGLKSRDIPWDFSIDYAVMHWTGAPSGTDDFTHFLGFKITVPWEASQDKTAGERTLPEAKKNLQPPASSQVIEAEKIALSQQAIDKKSYFEIVRGNILKNLKTPQGLDKDTTVDVAFSLSSDGQLKGIYTIDTEDLPLKEAIIRGLNTASFPAFSEDITKEEIRFNLSIEFTSQV